MLLGKDYNRLLHDLKRVSRCIKLVREENKKEKRDLILELLLNEVDRLFEDLEDAKTSTEN